MCLWNRAKLKWLQGRHFTDFYLKTGFFFDCSGFQPFPSLADDFTSLGENPLTRHRGSWCAQKVDRQLVEEKTLYKLTNRNILSEDFSPQNNFETKEEQTVTHLNKVRTHSNQLFDTVWLVLKHCPRRENEVAENITEVTKWFIIRQGYPHILR